MGQLELERERLRAVVLSTSYLAALPPENPSLRQLGITKTTLSKPEEPLK